MSKIRSMTSGWRGGGSWWRAEERFHNPASSSGGAAPKRLIQRLIQPRGRPIWSASSWEGHARMLSEQVAEVGTSSDKGFFHASDLQAQGGILAWSLHQGTSGAELGKQGEQRRENHTHGSSIRWFLSVIP